MSLAAHGAGGKNHRQPQRSGLRSQEGSGPAPALRRGLRHGGSRSPWASRRLPGPRFPRGAPWPEGPLRLRGPGGRRRNTAAGDQRLPTGRHRRLGPAPRIGHGTQQIGQEQHLLRSQAPRDLQQQLQIRTFPPTLGYVRQKRLLARFQQFAEVNVVDAGQTAQNRHARLPNGPLILADGGNVQPKALGDLVEAEAPLDAHLPESAPQLHLPPPCPMRQGAGSSGRRGCSWSRRGPGPPTHGAAAASRVPARAAAAQRASMRSGAATPKSSRVRANTIRVAPQRARRAAVSGGFSPRTRHWT
jgi:hypothetical protein